MRIFTFSFLFLLCFSFATGQNNLFELPEGLTHERIDLISDDSNSKFQICGLQEGYDYEVRLNSEDFDQCDYSIEVIENLIPRANKQFSFKAAGECQEFVIATQCALRKRYLFNFSITKKGTKPPEVGVEKGPLAVLVTTVNTNATDLVENVLFPGSCYTISNVVFSGNQNQIGNFSSGTTSISMEEGLIMCTGSILDAPGPNSSSTSTTTYSGGFTDADLSSIAAGGGLNDYAYLEFDIVPTTIDFINFDFVFATEEYCEFSNSTTFNDVFACFLSGPGITGPYTAGAINIAQLPTNQSICNNNVNETVNTAYFIDNIAGATCGNGTPYAPNDLEYDGFTTVLTASATGLTLGGTYHMKLAIADRGDGGNDAAVFIETNNNPCCPLIVNLGPDISICEGDSYSLSPALSGATGSETYSWSATPASALGYLSATNILDPTINLPAGTPVNATFTLTVTGSTCSDMDDIVVTTMAGPNPTDGDYSFCEGGGVTLDPGIWNTYNWSTNETTPTITVVSGGVYTVTVTDGSGCPGIGTFNVTESPLPDATITGGPTFCAGGSVDISAPAGYASYAWNTGASTQTITVSTPGNYSVTVTDANMCTNSSTVTITESTNEPVDILPSGILCAGGSIDLDAGAGYNSYSWSTSETTQTISVSSSGTYGVTVEGSGGCIYEGTIDITQAAPLMPTIDGDAAFCAGTSTDLSVSGGTFTGYLWSDSSTDPTLTVTSPGTISVTVTDADGCTGEATLDVTEDPLPTPSVSGDMTICPGVATTYDAGAGYTMYSWSGGGSGQTNDYDTPGTYSVTVTDGNGCEGETSFTITEEIPPSPMITGDLMICPDQTTTLDAGAGYTMYSWSGGGSGQTNDYNSPGTYSVTVTDGNGCVAETSVTVTENTPPQPNITGVLSVCPIGNTSTTLDAGAGFVSYSWSGGGMSQTESFIGPGNYTVTVTDDEGCEGEQTVTVDEFPTTDPVVTGDNTLCPGQDTQLDAGAGFMGYSWSTGDMTQQTTIPGVGTYTVTVTDGNGCETEGSFTATPAEVPVPQILGDPNFCEGDFTTLMADGVYSSYNWGGLGSPNGSEYIIGAPGVVTLDVTNDEGCEGSVWIEVVQNDNPIPTINGNSTICQGETGWIDAGPGYASYLWNNGWNQQVLGVNDPGSYTVTVTDAFGCMGEASIDVEQAANLSVNITGETEICEDGGSTVLDAGAGFNSYEWSNGANNQVLAVFAPGTYSVTVTNTTGCTGEASVVVTELPVLNPMILGTLQICEGGSTTLSLSEVYHGYEWSDGSTGATFEATTAGTVSVEVSDDYGCTATTSVEVTLDTPDPIQISGILEVCEGGSTELTADAGFASYLWSTGSTDQSITVDTVGLYSVTGITAEGCESQSEEVEVTLQPTEITISGDTTFCEGSSVVLSVTPGFDTYEWSDGTMGNDQSFDQAGALTVTATSATGCTAQSSVTLVIYALPEVSIVGSTSFCPGGAAELSSDGVFASYLWSDNSMDPNLTVTSAGSYGLTVTDSNGCEGSDEVLVEEQSELSPVISGDLFYCEGSSTTLDVGASYATYNWSSGSNSPTAEITSPGTVSVSVTDAFGCSGEATVEVVENANPTFNIQGEDYFCSGDTATVFVEDIYATYSWSTGSTTSMSEVSTAGTVSLMVTDVNGCEGSNDFEVTEAALPDPQITGDLSYCPGLTTTITGEPGYDSYTWTGGVNTEDLEVGTAGNYELTVEDSNGCIGSNSVNVIESFTEEPQISGVTDFCPGASTTLEVTNSFVSYNWSTGDATAQIQADEANTYSVVVTDGNGCETTASVTTTIFTVTDPQITGPSAFCTGDMVSLDAGAGYASYDWSTTASSQQISVSSGDTYEVTVTDGNGCETMGSYEVTENALPEVNIGGSTSYCVGGFTTLNAGATYANYAWSEGSTSQSIDVSSAETFSLTVTDDNGCVGIGSVDVTEDTELNPVISGPLSYCAAQTTTLDAGTGFATYVWNDNSNASTLEVSSPGTYSVTVTDNGGCTGETSVEVTENALPQPQISGVLEYCATQSTMLDAGTGFDSYDWSTGDNDQMLEVNSPGIYTVVVTNSFGCVDSTMVEVTENALPQPQISGVLEYCATQSTTLDAGTGFASYDWSTGDNDQTLEVSSPGMYTVAVTNSFGCVDSTMVEVTENALPQPQISGVLEYCATQNTTLDAGMGFDSYDWSTGDVTQNLTVSNPGIYTVAVTNSFGCVDSTMVEVTENPLPQPQISGALEFCAGDNTMLDVGAGYTSYDWSTGDSDQMLEVNTPGMYMVAVTNSFGCIDSTSVEVVENELPTLSITGTPYYCAGAGTQLEVTGTFTDVEWTDSSDNTTVEVTTPGVIGATATNEFGCEAYEEIQVEEIALPQAVAGDDLDLDCEVLTTVIGSDQTSTGSEYVYSWTGPGIDTTNDYLLQPEVDMEGQYTLVVTDTVHNCVSEESMIQIVDLAYVPLVSLEVMDDLDCVTESVTLDGSGSHTGPEIIYSWRDGVGNIVAEGPEQMIEVSEADIYSLEVMDMATGCHNMDSVEVMENIDIPLALAGEGGHLDCNVLSYTLDGTSSAAGNNISYSWEAVTGFISSGGNTATPEVTQPGVYILTVLNEENGCEGTDDVLVTQDITAPVANAGEDQEIDCHSETVTINASGTSTGSNIVLTWSYGGSPLTQDGLIFDVSEPGIYTLQVENLDNGCTSQSEVLVTLDADAPTGILAEMDSPTCFGDADGSIVVAGIEGGTPPYLYSINGGAFTGSPGYQGLTGGVYSLVVQDVEGCEYEEELILADGNDLQLDLGEDQYINLGDEADVDAIVNVDPAELLSIIWQAPDSLDCEQCLSFSVQPMTTSEYTVTVMDDNGCIKTEEVTIFVNRPHEVFIPNVFSPNGDGNNDILMIFAGKDVETIHSFLIFNRWGENVFEVYDFPPNLSGFGWDGYDRGKLYNAQVFTYFAEVEFIDGEVVLFKGDITLVK